MVSIIEVLVILLVAQQIWLVVKRSGVWPPRGAHPSTPLEIVRERFAQGLISHAEMERLVATLIVTENMPTSATWPRVTPRDYQASPAFVSRRLGGGCWGPYPNGTPNGVTHQRERDFCGCRF